jgi:hypothetical protein
MRDDRDTRYPRDYDRQGQQERDRRNQRDRGGGDQQQQDTCNFRDDFDDLYIGGKNAASSRLNKFAKGSKWNEALTSQVREILKDKDSAAFLSLDEPSSYQLDEKSIVWPAFPDALDDSREQHWIIAEEQSQKDLGDGRYERRYENQDEYCEWTVEKRDGKIVKVVFTTEFKEVCLLLP